MMDRMPPELLLEVFSYLDGPAPSELTLHDQPSEGMLSAASPFACCPLKSVSLVSKTWRALVLQLLFRHVLWRPAVSSLSAFTLNPLPLLKFLEAYPGLPRSVRSFTLLVSFDDPVAAAQQVTPRVREQDLQWLWEQIFATLDPLRFTIVARPTALAALLGRMLFLDDAWSFDMPYHVLSLSRPDRGGLEIKEAAEQGAKAVEEALSPAGPARTSRGGRVKAPPSPLFHLRPWRAVLLNEGSSVKVYRTYEFFLRRPPSMLGALLGCEEAPNNTPMIPSTVTDFSYVAIFPLSTHFETLLQHLPRIERLYVQLTPKAGDNILDDENEMRHVDPADLWMERNTSYSFLMRKIAMMPTLDGPAAADDDDDTDNWGALRVFESGDAADREAWDIAIRHLETTQAMATAQPATTGWKVEREGVLVRQEPKLISTSSQAGPGPLRRIAFNGVAKLPFSSFWLYSRGAAAPAPSAPPNAL
ncbi:hypothetical protein F4780DRAFT_781080 [Xylariomycetidae sp. FL0641]|nr:hypothetical protein F4780DRAFT_781080 [Xylariomycetidae sp. FL0641]